MQIFVTLRELWQSNRTIPGMGSATSPAGRVAKTANIKFHVSADFRYYVITPQKLGFGELRRADRLLQLSVSLGLIFGVVSTLEMSKKSRHLSLDKKTNILHKMIISVERIYKYIQ